MDQQSQKNLLRIIDYDSKNPYSLSLEFLNSDTSLVNVIRRVMYANVQNYAFHYFDVKKNISKLHNDFLTHRISLCPVIYSSIESDFENFEFSLKKKCEEDELNVYSHDIIKTRIKKQLQSNDSKLDIETQETSSKKKKSKKKRKFYYP